MPTYSVTYGSSTATHKTVSDAHFGANAIHDVNINAGSDFAPDDGFEAAIDALDITHLRYPAGVAESELDITRMSGGNLRAEVSSFLDWAAAKQVAGSPLQVTLTLPTKSDIPADQIRTFVTKVLTEYGDLIAGFEIGNEYSIGPTANDPDRSEHPEDSGDDAYAMGETEYGIVARPRDHRRTGRY